MQGVSFSKSENGTGTLSVPQDQNTKHACAATRARTLIWPKAVQKISTLSRIRSFNQLGGKLLRKGTGINLRECGPELARDVGGTCKNYVFFMCTRTYPFTSLAS